MYITATEWRKEYGGKKEHGNAADSRPFVVIKLKTSPSIFSSCCNSSAGSLTSDIILLPMMFQRKLRLCPSMIGLLI